MSIAINIPTTSKRGDACSKSDGTAGAQSDTLALRRPAVGLMLLTAGAIKFKTFEGDDVTFASGELTVGVQYAFRIKQVYDTGTTLTDAQFMLLFSRY